ncbi:MAG: AAA family ATPase [Candidatus Latescibacterota bacterium]|jgi:DNA repair protein RadA/Sms
MTDQRYKPLEPEPSVSPSDSGNDDETKVEESHATVARFPKLQKMSDVEPRSVDWLWQDRIPFGELTIFEGDPGVGKSTISLDIAARLSRGDNLPNDSRWQPVSHSLLIATEDDPNAIIRPLLSRLGADLTKISIFPQEASFAIDAKTGAAQLEHHIRETDARFVVFDPIGGYMASGKHPNNEQDVREFCSAIAQTARKTGCAIVGIRHLNKNSMAGTNQRGAGSMQWAAVPRSKFLVGVEGRSGLRAMVSTKASYCKAPDSLGFEINDGGINWTGVSQLTDDDLLAQPLRNASPRDLAMAEIQRVLKDGPVSSTNLGEALTEKGISHATGMRARRDIGVVVEKIGMEGGWQSSLPAESVVED